MLKEVHGNEMIRLVCRESDSLIIEITDRLVTENTTEILNHTENNGLFLFMLKLHTNENENVSSQRIAYIVSCNCQFKIWKHFQLLYNRQP